MKPSNAAQSSPNVVVADRQWVRRVKQEEINMIDSFAGQNFEKINAARRDQTKNHFYPQHTRMTPQPAATAAAAVPARPAPAAQSRASRARDPDGLDSASQGSVLTPKSRAGDLVSRASECVSYVSAKSGSTTLSTK